MKTISSSEYRVAIVYRVAQAWRVPVFNKLQERVSGLRIYIGPDFQNSKVRSGTKGIRFDFVKLQSLKLILKGSYDKVYLPYSPALFYHLLVDRPEVVISEGKSNIINAIQAFFYCKLFNKKFVWWSLGALQFQIDEGKFSKLDWLVGHIVRRSSHIITYSSVGLNWYENFHNVPRENITIASNVVDTDYWISKKKSRIHASKNGLKLLFVGAIEKSKNLDFFIELMYSLIATDTTLNIVGGGSYLEELRQSASNLSNITFHGPVTHGVEDYFNEADVFILPGLGGLAISHAMCFGIPVICSIGDGTEKDLVINGKTGFLLDQMTVEAVVSILKRDINKTSLIAFEEECLKMMKQNSITNYVEKIVSVL